MAIQTGQTVNKIHLLEIQPTTSYDHANVNKWNYTNTQYLVMGLTSDHSVRKLKLQGGVQTTAT